MYILSVGDVHAKSNVYVRGRASQMSSWLITYFLSVLLTHFLRRIKRNTVIQQQTIVQKAPIAFSLQKYLEFYVICVLLTALTV